MPNTKAQTHRSLPEAAARSLGHTLRRRRDDAGLTQETLATRAGVSVQMVRRLEAGTSNPTLGTLYAIATALDVAWPDLLVEVEL
ncbi:helix-turn-helix transcriptional regulator [Nocardioides sp. HDW12B]|uniref:helix-turn-helix transcriptional regulator n=1 Tax=Nocardioides sp. HDW12B TaxID=2714939 RepID=UPI001F0F45A5|nr:helix-turn-helix transcriptional regulator [Nocardioides sp. HDW12B]